MTEYIHSKDHKIESFNLYKEVYKIYSQEGFFALYRGFLASFLSCHHSVIQFSVYETLKKKSATYSGKDKNNIPYYLIMGSSIAAKSK